MYNYNIENRVKNLELLYKCIKCSNGSGIQNETDPTVPSFVKSITQQNIDN